MANGEFDFLACQLLALPTVILESRPENQLFLVQPKTHD